MAKAAILTSLIFLSFLFPISSPVIPSETILDAVEILSDSGFVSMSLTLQLLAQTLISQSSSSSLTIFAPSDTAFEDSGQPPLSLIQFHFSPLKLSAESLKTLPFGTKIPTFFDNHSLIVTSSDQDISLNNVTLANAASAIYDVGSMAVYGIHDFLNPSFEISQSPSPVSVQSPGNNNLGCGSSSAQFGGYQDISESLLVSRYSVMGAFLDLQLIGMGDDNKLTIFAPNDEEMEEHLTSFTDYASLFRRHVVPCKLTWTDLVNLEQGAEFPTFLKGYNIRISRFGDILAVNGVPIVFREVYLNDTVVVHGIGKMLDFSRGSGAGGGDSSSEYHGSSKMDSVLDYGGEF